MPNAIHVEQLSKRYRLGESLSEHGFVSGVRNLWNACVGSGADAPSSSGTVNDRNDLELWALRDVTFDIEEGEVIGFVGRNGAGKSTLLKILSRITEPTTGRVEIRGRVGSLLEVGTGFHPELTGRENVFLNGSILGMSRQEIKRNFDAIVEFSEIDRFLDTPVKRYSSGMYVRLAFAVAAHLRPDILLVDEVLSVGDLGFREKCFRFLRQLRESGVTIVVVSHDLAQVSALAQRCIWLDRGQIRMFGRTDEVIAGYTNLMQGGVASAGAQESTGAVELVSVKTVTADGTPTAEFTFGEDIHFELEVRVNRPVSQPRFGLAIYTNDGIKVWMHNTLMAGVDAPDAVSQNGTVRVILKSPPFLAGDYHVWTGVSSPGSNSADLVSWPECLRFSIRVPNISNATLYAYTEPLNGTGIIRWPATWELPWRAPS